MRARLQGRNRFLKSCLTTGRPDSLQFASMASASNSIEGYQLDASRSEKKLWLIKVPNFVAKKWHEACTESINGQAQAGPELGRVCLRGGANSLATSCTLTLAGPTAEAVPKEYNMRTSTGDMSGIHAFAEEADQISVCGRIDQRFDAEMKQGQSMQGQIDLSSEYRMISRDRSRAAATKTRTAQVIDPQSVTARVSYGQLYANKRKIEARGEKKIVEKRVRMDKERLENLLFRLFERKDFWNFQHLVTEADQPVAWLKEVLLEVAVQNKKPGPHRDHWQLKPEFRIRDPPAEEN